MFVRKVIFACALALAAAGCAAKSVGDASATGGVTVLPMKASVYLRATTDSDPSQLIGAFIPDDVDDSQLDESVAMRTRCSDFIKPKKIAAAGEYEEVFGASASVGGKVGVKGIAYLKGDRTNSNALRVRYKALEKMVADVDTEKLYQCCQAAPNQCTKRYISNFLFGDGQIYAATETANEAGLEAQGSTQGIPIAGDVMYKDGLKWERKITFNGQYFSFGLGRGMDAASTVSNDVVSCDWANNLPQSLDGQYFVGVSDNADNERIARQSAMEDARRQVVKYLGDFITDESSRNEKLTGASGVVSSNFEDVQLQNSISAGLARLVKEQKVCKPELIQTGTGTKMSVKVLAFFPNTERAAAMKISLTTLMDTLKSKNQLSADKERALKAALDSIR